MIRLVLASSNSHKAQELAAMLPDSFHIVTLSEIGFKEKIQENAATIRRNSLIKASAVKQFLFRRDDPAWVIADDSGLEVLALEGAPGVRSARYAGEQATDEDNVKKLLSDLTNVTDRRARFVTVLTLLTPDEERFFEGEVKGTITYEPRGKGGFGYDPVFVPTGYRSTFAEMPAGEKNLISHRAAAVKKLSDHLRSLY